MDILVYIKHNLLISNNLDHIWFWKKIPITFSQGCTVVIILIQSFVARRYVIAMRKNECMRYKSYCRTRLPGWLQKSQNFNLITAPASVATNPIQQCDSKQTVKKSLLSVHTIGLLWEKFRWILPLYMKPIRFQSKASVVCSVTEAIFIDFRLKKLNVFSSILIKKMNIWIPQNKSPGIEMLINCLC